jgi:5-(carboxyamino)imidazole ribonucleotide synthase
MDFKIGILGSGQLGRMLAIAARYRGYRVHVLSPDSDSPTGQIADKEYTAAYDDLDAVAEFARGVDVVTYEFENVPAATAVACQQFAPLRPGAHVLHIAQNRLREKQFMVKHGLPVAQFVEVNSLADLMIGLETIGLPAVLKTAVSGYDGKGQTIIPQSPVPNRQSSAEQAWEAINKQPAILEQFIEFEREVSVVAARGMDGSFTHYGVIQNAHRNHILDVSVAPAPIPDAVAERGVALARRILEALDVVGVLCVEFFLTKDGQFLINEIEPRPHNSGHLTVDACVTSQFEQQLRAVCGLPLGDTSYHRPAAMANLLGDLWQNGEPDWAGMTAVYPQVKLHLYGKREARPGRKMGHLTAVADNIHLAEKLVREARRQCENNE